MNPGLVVFLQKSLQAAFGFVTAMLGAIYLSPADQGYYYTMGSLLSSYVFLDLGLSTLLVQIAARMMSGLQLAEAGAIVPSGDARTAFLSMATWAKRWYVRASLVALMLIPIGGLYFSRAQSGMQMHWFLPWIVVVLSVALSMRALPMCAIIEGAGRVAEVYWVRIAHYTLGAVLAWGLLIAGMGLYALAMAPLAIALVVYWWARVRYQEFASPITDHALPGFDWKFSVWPLQRKVIVSWLAGYLFLNVPTLVVFYFGDAPAAGRLGLSMVVANILGSLAASWLISRTPKITLLLAESSTQALRRLFLNEFQRAMLLMIAVYGAAGFGVMLLGMTPFATRILTPIELALLFSAFVVFHGAAMLSIYFRAHGRELLAIPLLASTLVSVLTSAAAFRFAGLQMMLLVFFLTYAVIALPAMFVAWRKSSNVIGVQEAHNAAT